MKVYRVGGVVRDRLLGISAQDSDWVVVGATPDEMLALGYTPVGKDFPVFLHPVTHEEYALARTERKTAPGYKGFIVHAERDVPLEDDLRRRDLTINAIAEDEHGQLIDPFGGVADLNDKVLRHVSPAFVEDPVRILRLARFAARFATRGFVVAHETQELMKQMVTAGEVDALVPERVWQELVKAMAEPMPSAFIQVLRDCGALVRLLPELDRLFGVPQRPEYHPEIDTGVHVLLVMDRAALLGADAQVVFAAMLHDLGKGTTPQAEWPRHVAHEKRSVDLVKDICRRFRVPTEYRDLAVHVARFHGECHRALELKPSTIVKLFSELDLFRRPERFERFLLACQADAQGRTGLESKPYPQAEYLRGALVAAQTVSSAELIAQGLSGVDLGNAILVRRAEAVAQYRRAYAGESL